MSTAVAPQKPAAQMTIRDHLKSPQLQDEIARVLPKHLKPERMMRVALTAIAKTPKLADCDQASFFNALLNLSQWGLEPDGRRAHLIPFENRSKRRIECQLILDYKGVAELCYRSGTVSSIHADVVRRGDLFTYSRGRVIEHVQWFLRDPANRPESAGDVYAVYCMVELNGGAEKHDVMSTDDVNAVRDKSQGYQAYVKKYVSTSPWVDYWNEMAKKTVFKRCSKWLPWSAEIHAAMEADDGAIDVPSRIVAPTTSLPAGGMLEQLTAEMEGGDVGAPEDEGSPSVSEQLLQDWEAIVVECETADQVDEVMKRATTAGLNTAELGAVTSMGEARKAALKKKK